MKSKNTTILSLALATALTTTATHAAVVLQYDSLLPASDGSDSALSIVGTTDASFVSAPASNSVLGSNVAGGFVHGSQNQVDGAGDQNDMLFRFGSNAGGSGVLSGTVSDSLAAGAYIQFSFTAAQDLTLDQLSFKLFNNSNNSNSYSAREAGLFVDIDGSGYSQFGSTFDSATNNGNQGTVTFNDNVAVSSGEVVTYRLAFTDRTRTNNDLQAATRIGDVQISAVPIPEPSSAALLGLSGLAFILRRRR
ncbi:PEP-CTERM sorting domain-containing protein [Verrucomicrobiaceae bacterium R5-34]|uniref:PEP-CTERM sorting domain-containing protein n=1 Tax=Oceaniferula flava TaxID=2800421 RepID=A0AAE2VD07_9BACT|nr:PEP-CTERM sorting domain-containing protein [Oceaniferula flavus]MBK1831714.1 PEP-CTERM sorting domain-containing protein [Verrucomicrobiaceae bacterium R5-34]MBK1853949.1 PEP-CTERM sorting domain-containing protein [Oceaniferula flavus]MBM1135255.1 PEP-CTERM sorting domain-containing protein [Oceaniferula flavus]